MGLSNNLTSSPWKRRVHGAHGHSLGPSVAIPSDPGLHTKRQVYMFYKRPINPDTMRGEKNPGQGRHSILDLHRSLMRAFFKLWPVCYSERHRLQTNDKFTCLRRQEIQTKMRREKKIQDNKGRHSILGF